MFPKTIPVKLVKNEIHLTITLRFEAVISTFVPWIFLLNTCVRVNVLTPHAYLRIRSASLSFWRQGQPVGLRNLKEETQHTFHIKKISISIRNWLQLFLAGSGRASIQGLQARWMAPQRYHRGKLGLLRSYPDALVLCVLRTFPLIQLLLPLLLPSAFLLLFFHEPARDHRIPRRLVDKPKPIRAQLHAAIPPRHDDDHVPNVHQLQQM